MTRAVVIGPGRTGTTLMISLLDNHPEITAIPLEVKFYEHYYNALSCTSSYDITNDFFLNNSKLKLLNTDQNNMSDPMNSGRVDFSMVDFDKLKEKMSKNARLFYDVNDKSILPLYIEELHKAYSISVCRDGQQRTFVNRPF